MMDDNEFFPNGICGYCGTALDENGKCPADSYASNPTVDTRNISNLFVYGTIANELAAGYGVSGWYLKPAEWLGIAAYLHTELQENDGSVYAAVLSTPGFELSELEATATQEQDDDFEDMQEAKGRLRI